MNHPDDPNYHNAVLYSRNGWSVTAHRPGFTVQGPRRFYRFTDSWRNAVAMILVERSEQRYFKS